MTQVPALDTRTAAAVRLLAEAQASLDSDLGQARACLGQLATLLSDQPGGAETRHGDDNSATPWRTCAVAGPARHRLCERAFQRGGLGLRPCRRGKAQRRALLPRVQGEHRDDPAHLHRPPKAGTRAVPDADDTGDAEPDRSDVRPHRPGPPHAALPQARRPDAPRLATHLAAGRVTPAGGLALRPEAARPAPIRQTGVRAKVATSTSLAAIRAGRTLQNGS